MSTSRWMPPYTSIQRIMAPPDGGAMHDESPWDRDSAIHAALMTALTRLLTRFLLAATLLLLAGLLPAATLLLIRARLPCCGWFGFGWFGLLMRSLLEG